jgi:hypothetical protein
MKSSSVTLKYLYQYMLMMAAVALVCFSASQSAWAAVAANTHILNQASLTYDSGAGSQTVTAEVDVTVALVPGAPTLSSPTDASTPYVGSATPLNFTYQITANGNGPDTYSISGAVAGSTNTSGATVSTPASVLLGASIAINGSTATVIQVPSDGTANNSVNGIEVGNTVVIAGEVRQVSAVNDPATGTATITLATALSAAPAPGEPIVERQDITVTVYSGTMSVSGTDVTVTVDITAGSAGGSNTDQVTATYTSGAATLTKYVRNITWAAGNTSGTGAAAFTTNGSSYNYYTGGVTGRPGDVLEYVLVARNSGAAAAGSSVITDVLPGDFVTFHVDSWATTADVLYVDETNTENQLTQEADSDVATLSGNTLTVNVGAGANASTGGSIPSGVAVRVTYQVTINP